MENNVFRKVSLDRLSSPEQLDQLMQVTTPKGWLALAAVGALLVVGIVWSLLGDLPEKVHGQGILLKSGGVFTVVPSTGGRVADLAVGVGEVVSEGQVVARLEQPELAERVKLAQQTLANLKQQYAVREAFGRNDLALQTSSIAQQQRSVQEGIKAAEENVRWLSERIATQQQLVEQGLLTKQTLLTTRQQLNAARESQREGANQLTLLSAKELGIRNQHAEQRQALTVRVQDAETAVGQIGGELRAKSEVVSPYNGRVLELMAEQGNVVGQGEPILTLDLRGRAVKDLEAIVYVPSVEGKKLKPGMVIQLAPSTVRQEEYGFMLGRITYVSDFPATTKGMMRVLKNDQLVASLSRGDAPYEVHADLAIDPASQSGYRWSSSRGPAVKVQSGTICTGDITVTRKHPIAMVIPLARKYTGI